MVYPKNRAFFTRCFALLIVLTFVLEQKDAYCQNGRSRLSTVVIDAGHGGKDSGAKGKFSQEKDVVLSVALKVGRLISENCKDVKVIYTRSTDEFIPLDQRSHIANKNNANLFISIHANSNRSNVPYGAETYVMGLHKSAENFEVAATENSAVILEDNYTSKYEGFNPKSAESYIMFSMMQSKFLDQSLYFAQLVQKNFGNHAKRSDRGVKQAGFLVLWRTAMPSVLVELGFISNASEERYLNSESGQQSLAESIYKSFKSYKISYETSNYSVIQQENISGRDTVPSLKPDSEKAEIQVVANEGSNNDRKEQSKADIIDFRVQIAAAVGKPLSRSQVRNLGMEVNVIKAGRVYKYTAGVFNTFNEANVYLNEVKRKFKDAFVIATKNGELISINDVVSK